MKGLTAGLFEPRDIRNVLQPRQHLLILFDGEDDRDGFATAGDYFWFFGQRSHEMSLTDSSCGVNLRSTFGYFQGGIVCVAKVRTALPKGVGGRGVARATGRKGLRAVLGPPRGEEEPA